LGSHWQAARAQQRRLEHEAAERLAREREQRRHLHTQHELFARSVGPVHRLRDRGLAELERARPAPHPRQRELDEQAPTHLTVPSGSNIALDYQADGSVILAARLQEMFGLSDTPRIAGGKVPLTIHLLSPARRPVQVTRDLAGFWRGTYFEVRKDLKGRYPRHYWPDDPLVAEPTRRAKPRGRRGNSG